MPAFVISIYRDGEPEGTMNVFSDRAEYAIMEIIGDTKLYQGCRFEVRGAGGKRWFEICAKMEIRRL